MGKEGFEHLTSWFVATCSNPLSYMPHPVSTGSVPGSTLKKGTFPLPSRFGLKRCESTSLSNKNGAFQGVKWERRDFIIEDLPYSIVTAVEFNHQVWDELVWFLYA
ncbi:hypothetical protein TIFTF001_025123 [Ficus carica]|uniref:Uncharacterized protein n=1 Tax=Ficus carica TaxID=3494 RepID=A0AA88APG3_FICCA|nr:hypothetical protein TIFTF001_025123 [Ficus carica]